MTPKENGKILDSDDRSHINKRTVISTRPSAPGDVDTAREHGILLLDFPAYYYRWITPSDFISDSVLSEPLPDAWVFTSRRGVEGWWRIWKMLAGSDKKTENSPDKPQKELLTPPKKVRKRSLVIPPVYVVGERTRQAFVDLFPEAEIRMAEEHNGLKLGLRMVSDDVGSVIHFCSVDRRSELREICRKFQIEITEVEVYRTTAVKDPQPVDMPVDAILFFSPNGVSEFKRLYGFPEGDWKPIAIGPTTAEAVERVTGRVPYVAQSPTFQEMLTLV